MYGLSEYGNNFSLTQICFSHSRPQLNAMSSDLATAIYDAIARNVIDELDQLHQQLLEKIRPKLLPKSPGVRKPVRVRWLEVSSKETLSASFYGTRENNRAAPPASEFVEPSAYPLV